MKITSLVDHPIEWFNYLNIIGRDAVMEPRNETHFIPIPYLV
ncbi:hypothetical protein P4H27_16940 [Paenibacillus taichungensis]|nr:hypothetical protein [Paenibacillus taichungensis]MEC0108648.1 hypothetical protein [Paenibacillus taichungensis]MEC0196148.1 hypothetical protein [Paenibacillus taichungensis]